MWEEILRMAIGNGLWAVLFCCLLAYLLKDGRTREGKYQQTITKLCEHLEAIDDVKAAAVETLTVVKRVKSKKVMAARVGGDYSVCEGKAVRAEGAKGESLECWDEIIGLSEGSAVGSCGAATVRGLLEVSGSVAVSEGVEAHEVY